MEMTARVRSFIVKNFLFGDESGMIDDGASLLDAGIIDSIGVLELVGFLEDECGLSVPDEDLVPENLDSVDNLVGYIQRRAS